MNEKELIRDMVTISTDVILRKSAQEVEIDHLLAEEFICDPSFAERFLEACGLFCPAFKVSAAIPEPSLGGEGFGDLLVDGTGDGLKVAFLIEDKITAGPAVRQAKRYAAHASWLRDQGWDRVWTILVAPAAYRGERDDYDASIDLEKVASILRSPDPMRLTYRRGIIERALAKKASTGVRIPDLALHHLKSAYLNYASGWCVENGFTLEFPALRESYYDGDSWIEPIRTATLPAHVKLRHRLWTSTKAECGRVDLIVSPASIFEQNCLKKFPVPDTLVELYSKNKGVQFSLQVPEIRQNFGFNANATSAALLSMKILVNWYLDSIKSNEAHK
jgi:hypothetical protein